jgi:hypothetical protein
MRLALIYCLLDGADAVDTPHLLAALAVWKYCDATAKYVFGTSLGDRHADEIMRWLAAAQDGMTRSEIGDAFGRHKTAEQIGAALELLQRNGRARCESIATSGRPREVWRIVK